VRFDFSTWGLPHPLLGSAKNTTDNASRRLASFSSTAWDATFLSPPGLHHAAAEGVEGGGHGSGSLGKPDWHWEDAELGRRPLRRHLLSV
jgi:hypothetical protein